MFQAPVLFNRVVSIFEVLGRRLLKLAYIRNRVIMVSLYQRSNLIVTILTSVFIALGVVLRKLANLSLEVFRPVSAFHFENITNNIGIS